MDRKAKILVVEDDLVARHNLEILLGEQGHEISGFADNAVDALVMFTTQHPDIVIVDISLKGSTDGIDLAKKLNDIRKVPVLFLTAHNDEEVFKRAKAAGPFAFISKPIERVNLERTVDLAVENALFAEGLEEVVSVDTCLYTRVGNRLKKIFIRDLEYIEVDGKYSTIYLGQRHLNCKISLKDLLDKLPKTKFVQVSRNFIINMDHIEDIDMSNLLVKLPHREIPISRIYKEGLFERLKII